MSDIDPRELGEKLLEIQGLDSKIASLKKEIDGLEEKHKIGELLKQLSDAREKLVARNKGLDALKHEQLKLDGELDILSDKIKKEEEKLFSGTIMNPKELSAIQAEILGLRKKRDEMETRDLEEMEEIDELRSDIEGLDSEVDRVLARENEARGAYNEELAEKEHQIREFEKERDRIKSQISDDTVELYEKLLREKGGLAVVRIDKGRNCGGCHIEFSKTQIDRFQHEEAVFQCEYCRRILVK